jgi:hypothetical protein
MTKVEDIAKAVSSLAPRELAKFRAWFDAFDGERFDERIARDAEAGKLNRLAEQALADFSSGRAHEL